MMQPSQILPSNAPPPQRDGEGLHDASRVLQEHSGNRQQNDFGFPIEYEQKYPASNLTENTYHHPQQQHQQPTSAIPQYLYHPQPQHRQPWRYGSARGAYRRYPTAHDEAHIHFESERLYRRFRQSDQYVKYRNRQSKDDKGNGDQKWPDELEKAFFNALVRWQPMGRRKQSHKGKLRGRNELIADAIEELTGRKRTRKQVSSHIQVLKPFVENDPLIMKYLSKEDMGVRPYGGHSHASTYGGGRRMSGYPVTAPPQTALRTTLPSVPRTGTFSITKLKTHLEVFEPIEFQMFVQQKHTSADEQERETKRLHTYTQSVSNPLGSDLQINDWQTLGRDFPLLYAMSSQRPLDCNVLVAEASLAFPTATFKDKDGSPLPGVELGISFRCSSRHIPVTPKGPAVQVWCNNSFYENGKCVLEHGSESTEVHFEPSDRLGYHDHLDTQIKFGSKFWAKTLGRLAQRLLNTSKEFSEGINASIRNITAVQEVMIGTELGPERILVIHWTFRQSTTTCGRAGWRKLLLPVHHAVDGGYNKPERADSIFDSYPQYAEPSASQYQHPLQPALQSPFEYDSSSGSALSSATWPTLSESGVISGQQVPDFTAENNFDFDAGNINIAYGSNINFDNFDSSAFNFDASGPDFAADPALQDYSQAWCDNQMTSFDGQGEASNFATQPATDFEAHTQAYGDGYGEQYDQHSYEGTHGQHAYDGAQEHHSQEETHDQQAYGGAVPDLIKDEDALAALADASYMASALAQI